MNLGTQGSFGETVAAEYLEKKGYQILARNYLARCGEIDIICRYDRYIVFVEVKTRGSNAFATGREAVTPSKQRRIIKTALIFLTERKIADLQPRFDIVEISTGESVSVRHFENAFDGSAFHGFI